MGDIGCGVDVLRKDIIDVFGQLVRVNERYAVDVNLLIYFILVWVHADVLTQPPWTTSAPDDASAGCLPPIIVYCRPRRRVRRRCRSTSTPTSPAGQVRIQGVFRTPLASVQTIRSY